MHPYCKMYQFYLIGQQKEQTAVSLSSKNSARKEYFCCSTVTKL